MGESAAPALGGERAFRARVTTIAGNGIEGWNDGPASGARFAFPRGVAADAAGNLYVCDTGSHRIRKIDAQGVVSTLAGDGEPGLTDGPGEYAQFRYPRGLAVDRAGNVYVADTDNNCVRKITPDGAVTTHSGGSGHAFADGARAGARFAHPNGVAVDPAGHVYVADASNVRVRKVSPGGTATTLAGDGIAGYADAPGVEARFSSPRGVALDALGHLYVVEFGNSRVRKIAPDGSVTTFAGDGRGAWHDGVGTQASFKDPCGVAVDAAGRVFVADSENHCIRLIDADGLVTTIAGAGGLLADFADGLGQDARFNTPRGVGVGPDGAIYVADTLNHAIRRIELP